MSGIHHSVIAVGDLESSLRFYRDGLGLDVLQDRKVEGDWPALFDGPSRTLHAVFLGDAHVQASRSIDAERAHNDCHRTRPRRGPGVADSGFNHPASVTKR